MRLTQTGNLDVLVEQARRLPTTAREAAVLAPRRRHPAVAGPTGRAHALVALRRYGILGAAIRIAADRDPDMLGLVDERRRADLRRARPPLERARQRLARRGLDDTSVIALLCRDHRGLVEAMFAGRQGRRDGAADEHRLREAAVRRGVRARGRQRARLRRRVHRHPGRGAGLDPALPRLGGRARERRASDAGRPDRRRRATLPAPRPKSPGGLVLLTSGTTGTPKGAPRKVSSPFAAAQFLDRIPLRPRERDVPRRSAVPRHRAVAVPARADPRLDDAAAPPLRRTARRSRRWRSTASRNSSWCRRCCSGS